MSDCARHAMLPPEQEAIRAKCFHPSGTFIPFRKEEVEQSISSRFEKMVEMYAGRIAVKAKDHVFTYDALNAAVNRVAHAILFQRGEGAEPIMLLLEHGASLIVAILGVLKAGKFFAPLDPSHPRARSSYIVENTQSGLILTNNQNLSLATELAQSGCRLFNIDKLDSVISTENPNLSAPPDTFACCLYTSGSTGQPKGVIQNHRNGLHDIRLWTESFHICPEDRLTLLAFETGQAIKTIYSAVLNGAALYPRDIKVEGVANLATWLIQEEITMYFSGAALFRYFLDTLSGEESFPKLRLIRLSSEQVSKRDVEGYKKHFSSDCILINALSSNEVGTFREYWIDKESHITSSTVPVGYAVEDKELLLLDDTGQEVSYESIGEIAVRSCYLSPGYWRRPDLTQTAFQPDLQGGSARVYQTGDLGRMAADGCLFHLGREDFRVKVRGYSVEVSEIEMALLEHAAIKEAAVIGQEIPSGDRRLVAYFVPGGQPATTVTELRNFLKDRLPDYMIPSAFVVLSALPLTPNGKVDRLGLPEPEGTRPELDTPFIAPRTPIEAELAGIWAEVLSLDQVGIHDDFYDLGGHSLAATRVASRVLKTFQLELPLKSLFRSPTVAEMAVMITEHQGKKLDEKKLHRILTELESLSEDDAHRLLSDQSKAANAED